MLGASIEKSTCAMNESSHGKMSCRETYNRMYLLLGGSTLI